MNTAQNVNSVKPAGAKVPGPKWVAILGVAGFAAGFFGPLVFVPEANQGPLVGILISGPTGVVAGLVLWAACALIKLPATIQWRMLYVITAVGVLMTLLFVQPEPALRGYVYEGEVESCATPLATETAVIADWNKRISEVTWAEPRAGWKEDFHRLLQDAPGVVVSVRMLRKNPIRENRKPWNRGSQYAAGWTAKTEQTLFYDADSGCDRYPAASAFRGFQNYDYNERIEAPKSWPPAILIDVLGASVMAPVPEKWASL